jgi:hypothetical protein
LKRAWRSGAVWREPEWRRRGITAAGALLAFLGVCAVLIVIGSAWIKVLFCGVPIYVFFQLGRAWARV